MLREYVSIPQKRLACKIEKDAKIEKVKGDEFKYTNKVGAIQELMIFNCGGKKAEVGDYIVRLSKEDQYLVKKDVFEKSYRCSSFKLK